MRIIVSGGGTAGHLAPILALVETLSSVEPNAQILYVGSGSELESRMLAEAHVSVRSISSGKFRRYHRGIIAEVLDVRTHAQNARDSVRLARGLMQARRIVRTFKPDVVFSKGGYVGVPVARAAVAAGIPLIIHESDVILGLANKHLAPGATIIGTGFPIEYYDEDLQPKMRYVGTPINATIGTVDRTEGRATFGFHDKKQTILIFGGSRGAHRINEAVFENIALLTKRHNIIHLTGLADIEQARFLAGQLPLEQRTSYKPFDFLGADMAAAYGAADVVLARAGASTLAEIAQCGIPALILPLSTSANNHQQANAEVLASAGAIRILTEHELSGLGLVSAIDKLIEDPAAMSYLHEQVGRFAKPKAVEELTHIILETGKKGS